MIALSDLYRVIARSASWDDAEFRALMRWAFGDAPEPPPGHDDVVEMIIADQSSLDERIAGRDDRRRAQTHARVVAYRERRHDEAAQALARAKAFSAAVKADPSGGASVFFSGDHDPIAMCVAMTGDTKSLRRWSQLAEQIPRAALVDALYAFYRERESGERPRNPGAALNARLGKLIGGNQ